MRLNGGSVWIELSLAMLEEVLMAASRTAPAELRARFVEEKDAIDTVEIVDVREDRFRVFDAYWAERFDVTRPLADALSELGGPAPTGLVVERVLKPENEKVSLYLEPDGGPRDGLVLKLAARVESVLDRDRLRRLFEEGRLRPNGWDAASKR